MSTNTRHIPSGPHRDAGEGAVAAGVVVVDGEKGVAGRARPSC